MSQRSWSQRIVLAAAALALVLKAAVPMVAAGAAELRNISVADVCPMYGVDMSAMAMPAVEPAQASQAVVANGGEAATATSQLERGPSAFASTLGDSGQPGPGHHGSSGHDERSADSCALSALATFAAPDVDQASTPALRHAVATAAPLRGVAVHDACAQWSARLKQGPPTA
jgi:hypothetical protein